MARQEEPAPRGLLVGNLGPDPRELRPSSSFGASRSPPTTSRLQRSLSSPCRAHVSTRVAIPLTRCSRPTERATGRCRRSGGREPSRLSRSASAAGRARRGSSATSAAATTAAATSRRALSMPDRSMPSATTVARTAGSSRSMPRRVCRSARRVGLGKSTRWAASDARRLRSRSRKTRCSARSASPKPARVRVGLVPRLDQGVRVGREGEHGGDAELGRRLCRGHRADVRHPEVDEVTAVRPGAHDGCRAAPPPAGATPRPRGRVAQSGTEA